VRLVEGEGRGGEEEVEGEEGGGGEEEEKEEEKKKKQERRRRRFGIFLGIDVVAFVAHYRVGFCCYVTNFSVLKMYVIVILVPALCLRNLLL
jgi:hypothetical protein